MLAARSNDVTAEYLAILQAGKLVAVDVQSEYISVLRLQAEARMIESKKRGIKRGRVNVSVTRRAAGKTDQDIGLRDKAADPVY